MTVGMFVTQLNDAPYYTCWLASRGQGMSPVPKLLQLHLQSLVFLKRISG